MNDDEPIPNIEDDPVPLPLEMTNARTMWLLQSNGIPATYSNQHRHRPHANETNSILVPRRCYDEALHIITDLGEVKAARFQRIPKDYAPKSKPVVGVGELLLCIVVLIFILNAVFVYSSTKGTNPETTTALFRQRYAGHVIPATTRWLKPSPSSGPSASPATLIPTGNSTSNKISDAYILPIGASFQSSHTQISSNLLKSVRGRGLPCGRR